MMVQTAASLTLLGFVAISCGSTRTELRPVSSAAAPQVSAASAPTGANNTPSSASSSSAGVRTLVAPGAMGHISQDVDDNANLVLTVELEHLPPPSDLDPALTTYVVWIRPNSGGSYQNAGKLVMDTNRRGELTTTTAHRDVEVLVTAEASATPQEPSRFAVLQGTASSK